MNVSGDETGNGRITPQPDGQVTQQSAQRGQPTTFPDRQRGKVGWILLWLIGIPVPVLIGLFLLRGCT